MIRPDDKLCPHFREKCLKLKCASYVRELGGTKVITNESTSGCSSPSCEDFFAPNGKMYISCKMDMFNEFEVKYGENTLDVVTTEICEDKNFEWMDRRPSRKPFKE